MKTPIHWYAAGLRQMGHSPRDVYWPGLTSPFCMNPTQVSFTAQSSAPFSMKPDTLESPFTGAGDCLLVKPIHFQCLDNDCDEEIEALKAPMSLTVPNP